MLDHSTSTFKQLTFSSGIFSMSSKGMATTPAAPPCIVADKSNIGVGTSINSFSEFIIPDCANLRNMAKRICEQLLKRLRSIYAI
ncbi:hypothetical protein M513_13444, partial [Trichuris suis]